MLEWCQGTTDIVWKPHCEHMNHPQQIYFSQIIDKKIDAYLYVPKFSLQGINIIKDILYLATRCTVYMVNIILADALALIEHMASAGVIFVSYTTKLFIDFAGKVQDLGIRMLIMVDMNFGSDYEF